MKSDNLKAAHDLYEAVHPLKRLRSMLSKDDVAIAVTGCAFDETAPDTIAADPTLFRAHMIAALNREIERINKLVENLE